MRREVRERDSQSIDPQPRRRPTYGTEKSSGNPTINSATNNCSRMEMSSGVLGRNSVPWPWSSSESEIRLAQKSAACEKLRLSSEKTM